jgi:hypothetical protein
VAVNKVLNKFTAAPVEVYSRLSTRQTCPVPYIICSKCYGSMMPAESGKEAAGMHIDCMSESETKDEEDKEELQAVERRIPK